VAQCKAFTMIHEQSCIIRPAGDKGIPHAQTCLRKIVRTSSVPDTGYTTHFQIMMIDEVS
jgi:hypothetical protein